MNNDISRNIYFSCNKQHTSKAKNVSMASGKNISIPEINVDNIKDSRECLNSFGHAQVNMSFGSMENLKKSVNEFIKDSSYVKEKVDFEDSLLKNGSNYEQTLRKSDIFFKTLSQRSTYI